MKNGFTLIEILVALSIIALLSGIFLVNFSQSRGRFALQRAVHKLAQDLREINQMALSPVEAICPGGKAVYEFGVYLDQFSPDRYILFANCDASREYNSGVDKALNTVYFEREVSVCRLSPYSPASIVFSPPVPKIYINGLADTYPEAQIILWREDDSLNCLEGGADRKVIEVNKSGLIEIK